MLETPFVEIIPSLIQGISTQAPVVRKPGQVEDANNISFNVVDGARKRPGTKYLAQLTGSSSGGNYRIHKIERDDQEEYAVIYGSDGYMGFVNINSGHAARITDVPGYITSQGDHNSLKFATIADKTFIANSNTTPRCTSVTGEEFDAGTMPVLMTLSDNAASFETPDWARRTFNRQIIKSGGGTGWFHITYNGDTTAPLTYDASAEWVANALQGNGVNPNSLVKEIRFNKTSSITHTIEGVSQTWQDSQVIRTGVYECIDPLYPNYQGRHPLNPFEKNVAAMAVVGHKAFPFGKVIVTGGPANNGDILVQFSPDIDMTAKLDCGYKTVLVGDNATDPPPAFACTKENHGIGLDGIPIRDIGFIRNRLVIAAGETISFSRVDDMFNFYLDQPPVQTDADPINVQLAAADVCLVDFMVPFRKSIIMLTSSGQQFELNGSDILTPSSVAISPTTKYETQNVRPVAIGNRLYMVGSGAGYSNLLEYYYSESSLSNVANNVSRHVDGLIPKSVYSLDCSPNQDSVFMVPTQDGAAVERTVNSVGGSSSYTGNWSAAASWENSVIPNSLDTIVIQGDNVITIAEAASGQPANVIDENSSPGPSSNITNATIFGFRTYNDGNERKQAAWTKWSFANDDIQDVKTFDDTMIILRRDGNSLIVEKVDLSEPSGPTTRNGKAFDYTPHLDKEQDLGSLSIVGSASIYALSLNPGTSATDIDTVIVSNGSITKEFQYNAAGGAGKFTRSGSSVVINENLTGYTGVAGRRITASLTLNQAFARDERGFPMSEGRTMIRKTVVHHKGATDYDVKVVNSEPYSPDRTISFTSIEPKDGTHEAWVNGKAESSSIILESDTGGPVVWSAIEQHGTYNSELRR